MKKSLITKLMLLISVVSFAQIRVDNSYAYSLSQPYKYQRNTLVEYFNSEDFVYTIKLNFEKFIIDITDKNKNELLKELIYEDLIPRKGTYETTIQNKDKLFILYSLWDKKENREQLYAIDFDKNTNEINRTPRLLFNSLGKVSGSYSGSFGTYNKSFDKYIVFKSSDNAKTLIKYRKNPAEKKDKYSNDVFVFNYFDDNLNLISTKEITMPYTERKMNNLNYLYRNNGDFIFIEKVFHNDTNDERNGKSTINYDVVVLTLKEKENELGKIQLNLNAKYFVELDCKENENNSLFVSGLYSNGIAKMKDIEGFVTFELSDKYEVSHLSFNKIPKQLIHLYEDQKKIKKAIDDKEEALLLKDLKIKNTFLNKDGSILIVAEEYYRYLHTNSKESYLTFHYNDMYIAKIDLNGKVVWMNKIPKETGENNYGSSGYSYVFDTVSNSHCFAVKSDYENLKWIDETLSKFQSSKFKNDSNLLIYKIEDISGNISASYIINLSQNDFFDRFDIKPSDIMSSKDNFSALDLYKSNKENIIMKVNLN